MELFLKGLIIGFSVAAPIGVIGLLCIQRTLTEGRWSGFFTGFGAAAADTVYGLLAAFLGMGVISRFLVAEERWIRLISGLFLLYLGIKMVRSRPASQNVTGTSSGWWSNFAATFVLLLTNPAAILFFLAVFSSVGVQTVPHQYLGALTIVFAIFLGSTLWWVILTNVTALLRRKISMTVLLWINRIAGCVILGFGLSALISSVRTLL